MTEPKDGWSADERAFIEAHRDDLDTLREGYAGHPPLDLLRAADAGVLPDDMQARVEQYLEQNPWARALIDASPSEDASDEPARSSPSLFPPASDARPARTPDPPSETARILRHPAWVRTIALVGTLAAGLMVALLIRDGADPRPTEPTAPTSSTANGTTSPPPLSTAVESRFQDGAVVVRRNGVVEGLEHVPPAFKASVERALVAGRLEIDQQVRDLQGKRSTLLGGSDASSTPALVSPVGVAVETRQPVFRWEGSARDEYQVSVFNDAYEPVFESGWIKATTWTAPTALVRGGRFSWQLRIRSGGREIAVPPQTAPEARFRVLRQSDVQALEDLRQRYPSSPILLASVYARLGLFDEAERALASVPAQTSASETAQQLRRELDRLRGR